MRISDWSSDVCSSDLVWVRSVDVRLGIPAQPLHQRTPLFGKAGVLGGQDCIGLAFTVERRDRFLIFSPLRSQYGHLRSEEHTSELQSLMRISYAVFCLKKKKSIKNKITTNIGYKDR